MSDTTASPGRRVTRSVMLPLSEIELRVSRSSGPGGQHANTSETRVEAVFDVEASSVLTDHQKARVVAKSLIFAVISCGCYGLVNVVCVAVIIY